MDFSQVDRPSRLQLAFDKTVIALLDLEWEQTKWLSSTRDVASEYLFTRHVLQHHAEPRSFAIRPRSEIDYVENYYVGQPQTDASNGWSQAVGIKPACAQTDQGGEAR